MTTYNHERYIAQAIEGVLSQRCDFPVELLLGEDCSTDATAEICREYAARYPERVRIITSAENVGWRENYRRTIAAAQGKYIAMCDGDDWWCDADKLQVQVALLEGDKECGMCYTRSKRQDECSGQSQIYPAGEGHEAFESMLRLNTAENCTVVARRDLIQRYYAEVKPQEHPEWLTDDLPMWLWVSANSQIRFIDRVTAVHRVVMDSVSHSVDYHKRMRFCDSLYEIMLWFDRRYADGSQRADILRRAHRDAMWALAVNGTAKELWQRWLADVSRTPRLLFCADAVKIVIKKRLLGL